MPLTITKFLLIPRTTELAARGWTGTPGSVDTSWPLIESSPFDNVKMLAELQLVIL
jgi:hypothetical protein